MISSYDPSHEINWQDNETHIEPFPAWTHRYAEPCLCVASEFDPESIAVCEWFTGVLRLMECQLCGHSWVVKSDKDAIDPSVVFGT